MSNDIIKHFGCGNQIPNKGYRVIRDYDRQFCVFENNVWGTNSDVMMCYKIIDCDGKLKELTTLGMGCEPLKLHNRVFVISHTINSIVRIGANGLIEATASFDNSICPCVDVKTNGSYIYGLYEDMASGTPIIKKYDDRLTIVKTFRLEYISNIPMDQLKHRWSVVNDDIFSITQTVTGDDNLGQKITFFTENNVLKEFSKVSNGADIYQFKNDDIIHVLNSNYMMLTNENGFMVINIIKKIIVGHFRTETRPNITIINDCEFMVAVNDFPEYCHIPFYDKTSLSTIRNQNLDYDCFNRES